MCSKYHFFRERLKHLLKGQGSILFLLSGGLDSCLLLKEVYSIFGDRVKAVTFISPFQPQRSINCAINFSKDQGINHIMLKYNPLEENDIATNSKKRCYLCKKKMYFLASEFAPILLDGTHVGDDPATRPGMRANIEFGVVSPWRQLGFGKKDIRNMARDLALAFWNLPSDSCLATRFPFDYKITIDELKKIEVAEGALKGLGFRSLRIRPADVPPRVLFSDSDYKRARDLGLDKIKRIIMETTRWYIKEIQTSAVLGEPDQILD